VRALSLINPGEYVMSETTSRRRARTYAERLANRQEGVHPSMLVEHALLDDLEGRPELATVELRAGPPREAIKEVVSALYFSPSGEFVHLGPGRRAVEGDADTVLKQLGNSLAARISAWAAAESSPEPTPVMELAARRRATGLYGV
jgi:hypothetical protein